MTQHEYYLKNRKRILEAAKIYYVVNKERIEAYRRRYSKKNHDLILKKAKSYYAKKGEKVRAYSRAYRRRFPEKVRAFNRQYYARNHEKIIRQVNEFQKRRMIERPEIGIMKTSVRNMLKSKGMPKTARARQYVGCSPGFLRTHLESLFKPGMTWENRGEWHVDHVVPLSWFPFDKDPSLLFVASHWTNLQPLWEDQNRIKSNKWIGGEQI